MSPKAFGVAIAAGIGTMILALVFGWDERTIGIAVPVVALMAGGLVLYGEKQDK